MSIDVEDISVDEIEEYKNKLVSNAKELISEGGSSMLIAFALGEILINECMGRPNIHKAIYDALLELG